MRATRRPSRSALLVIGLGLLWMALALAAGAMPARAGSADAGLVERDHSESITFTAQDSYGYPALRARR